jgi:outer membrane lipoprotein-sorting protein
MRGIRVISWFVFGLLGAGVHAGGGSAAANDALKQVSAALEGMRGVVAEVDYTELVGETSMQGSGKLYVLSSGFVRADVAGDEPRTVLLAPPYLYTYRHADQAVEVYDVRANPHKLGQYLLLGFVPAGKALKERFDVQLVDNNALDGKPALIFLITPKRKKAKEAALAIARIQLWVDPESGLPMRHEIVHSSGQAELHVRYLNISRDDSLPTDLFQPDWPEGTTLIRK